MQTKQQIQRLLASANAKPNRRLGQNFLIDLNLMRLLVDSADTQKDDVVLEVGCGTGSLTEAIAERCGCCIAVEIDNALAQIAANRLAGKPNVQIIQGPSRPAASSCSPTCPTTSLLLLCSTS